jgi:hypothetical protein
MPISDAQLAKWFTYHHPDESDIAAYHSIRSGAYSLAKIIRDKTPECADQTAALRKLREVVMTANAARACNDW